MKQKQNDPDKTQDELLEYIEEAEKVRLMTTTEGWNIIKNDISRYLSEIGNRLPYLDPASKEFYDSRLLYIASDKLIKMVEDYEFNRKKAEELLLKLNTQENVVMADVDNE